MFFSLASASGISITSANWFPSPSTNRALKDPVSVVVGAVGSCCFCVRSRASLFCRFEGGGSTVAMVKGVNSAYGAGGCCCCWTAGLVSKISSADTFACAKSGPSRRCGEGPMQLLPVGG